jgi:hypothetical protein
MWKYKNKELAKWNISSHSFVRYQQAEKKEEKTRFAAKTDRRQIDKNENSHAQKSTSRKKRTNQPHKSFFAGRAVSLPTHEQKLVSLALN